MRASWLARCRAITAMLREDGAARYLRRHPEVARVLLSALLPGQVDRPRGGDSCPERSPEVPPARTIWTYWDQGVDAIPVFHRLCLETWRRHCPDWQIVVLDPQRLSRFLQPEDLPAGFAGIRRRQAKSDLVRLALLARHGGVWMDSSILLQTGLDPLLWQPIERGRAQMGYCSLRRWSRRGIDDVLESWLIACRPRCPLVVRMHECVNELWRDRTDYPGVIDHPLFYGVDLQLIDNPEYLFVHAVFQALVQREPACREVMLDDAVVVPADATAFLWQ
ncbi:MAG: capsular polysaccharide synthesis protein, partial [Thermoanaerobaculia bacterium]|nr:capsular polysaccharide synthesis protein [Thermoanaerobaculia bacterium]